ncbi:MAG: DUF4838 domain-containing protein [Victivallales bacterium]|nr:DUF4838 domain-containing protein [Victivallales bacterium]
MKRLFLVFSMVFAAVANCASLDIAVKGKAPDYTIVIAKDAHAAYKSAAKEFCDFVEQITGVRLPQADDSGPLPAKAVLIGPTKYSKQVLGDKYILDSMDDDSFLLKAVGNHLVVLGKKRGGQYGVYELLEKFGGCRWYASWHSVIPKADKFSVPDDLDDFQKPAFFMREPFWYDMFRTMQAIRNKCNGNLMKLTADNGGKVRFGGVQFVHTFGPLVPLKKYWDTHPEYYSEINGKRTNQRTQLCLSNPDVLKIVTEGVLGWIRRDPDAAIFSVSQNDWSNPCQCVNCRALKEKYGTESGVMLWFVNQVAEAVEKEFPNVLIDTLAYHYTREPPKNIVPRHNVVPRLCTIELDFAHDFYQSNCEENIKFRKDLETWGAISKQLYVWDYVTDFSHYLAPYPNFYALQGNVKAFRDNHVIGLMEQGAYQADHADFAELKGWILAKLLWNPDVDVMALLDDFMKGYYGKAAPFVRQYFDELHERVKDPNFKLDTFMKLPNDYLTGEFLARAKELWEAAMDAVKDEPAYLYNVRKGAMTVYYAEIARLNRITPGYEWTEKGVVFDEKTRHIGELAVKFLECAKPVDGRVTRISEGEDMNGNFVRYCNTFVADTPVATISADGLKLSVAEGHGGAAGILSAKDGHNYFSGRLGGMTFLTCPADKGLISQFKITQKAVDRFVLEGPFANGSILNERLTLANGALNCEFDVKGGKEAVAAPRVLTIPLNLGNESNVCWRSGDGEWIECAMQENEQIGFFTLKDAAKGGTPIEIASPKTGRAVRFTFGKDIPDNFMLTVYPEHGDLLLSAYSFSEIPAGVTQTVSFDALPIAKADGLPESRRFVKSDKGRLFIEEYQMKMQSIRWGKIVADYRTGNGEALQLFNTHFEWCVQVMPDLSIFTPGVEYAVRFRIRVDAKPGKKGMAFWAGLYDITNKTGLGQISPKVTEVDGEYHWFTIAKWVPDVKNKVMAWCGPGKFDDGDATSINAVYVDCMEIVPASEAVDK